LDSLARQEQHSARHSGKLDATNNHVGLIHIYNGAALWHTSDVNSTTEGGFAVMTRATNAGTGVTRYLQVYTVLSQALAAGDIGAGEALPSEPALVRQYGVSRTTVRRALARLAAERCIIRRRGSGTFARDKVARTATARQIASIIDDPRGVGTNTTSRLLEFKHAPVPDFLHRDWPEMGATVLTIRRVRYVNDEPVALVISYVPESFARQLNVRRLNNDTVLAALEKAGFQSTTSEQQFEACAAEPVTAKHLNIGVGSPILNLKCLARDGRGRILRYANHLYRPDRYEVHTVVEREPSQRARQATRL
jgi:GntR family transcriptional regulator